MGWQHTVHLYAHPLHPLPAPPSIYPVQRQLYVWESQPEVLARHLLLLQVAQDWELPVRQRANLLLEVFGNCLVQVLLLAVYCSKSATVGYATALLDVNILSCDNYA